MDVDGTITFEDRKLDPAAVGALRRAEAGGIPVTLATGNVLPFAEAAAVLVGTSAPLIAEDGGVVFDPSTGKKRVIGDRAAVDSGLGILEGVFSSIKQTRSSAQRLTGATFERTIPREEAQGVLKKEGLNLALVDSGFAFHLKEPEVNKGNALREISSMTGIPLAEIAAIGDGPNDVEMLRTAGTGFAVANSSEEAKRASTHVTRSAHGKGVAEAVDAIISSSV